MTVLFSEAGLPQLDVVGPEFAKDPYKAYAEVHAAGAGVASCPFGTAVVGHRHLQELVRDPRLGPVGSVIFDMFDVADGPYSRWFKSMLVNQSGSEHARLRRLVAGTFSQTQANRMRPEIIDTAGVYLDDLAARGSSDFVERVGTSFPITIFCRMIGVPETDVPCFQKWAQVLGLVYDLDIPSVIGQLDQAIIGMHAYLEKLLDHRSGQSGGDLIQSLLDTVAEGARLTREELISLLTLLLGAGYDTTANELAWGVYLLAQQPDMFGRLAADSSLIPKFVEELLRRNDAAATTGRVATKDIEHDGILYPAGTYFLMSWAAAGRDPNIYPRPHALDLERQDHQTLLSFGWGEHYCLGAKLARVELEAFFQVFTQRFSSIELDGDPQFGSPLGMYTVKSLPIKVTSRG